MPGFILYWRDSVTEKPSPLTYNNKKTLLFLYLAASAEFTGTEKGTYETNINHLSTVVGESYFTTRNWLLQLQSDALITFQRCFKNLLKITICNYCELSGISKDALKMFQKPFKDASQLPSDFDELQPTKELKNLIINNKEKRKINKKKKEKFETRQDAVVAIAADLPRYVEYANSKTSNNVDTAWVRRELEKWSNWMDANNRSFSNYNKAFMNWLINATTYLDERQPVQRNRIEDIPLLSADDY